MHQQRVDEDEIIADLWLPFCTASADMTSMIRVPMPKIAPWPKFSQPSEVQTCVADRSYFAIETSKRSASMSSLPKYLTVSKLSG